MRHQHYFVQTQRNIPNTAEVSSHQLMLKARMIQRLASGLYSWTPIGLKVLKKVEAVVRKHMNASGAQELVMPMVQPAELWQESGRWEQYGPELLRLQDRHSHDFCLGPTHEEVITEMVRGMVKSYKQLPFNLYQIQTKFRDEIRPRFGVMRSREFLMKDAYSFHIDQTSLQETYDLMYETYTNIFTELGLEFCAVVADGGSIGGQHSHEFHVLADSGEDAIAFSNQSKSSSQFAANVEMVEALAPEKQQAEVLEPLEKVHTPNEKTIETICQLLNLEASCTVKTLIVNADDKLLALILRGDHQLSVVKVQKHLNLTKPLTFSNADTIKNQLGCSFGSIGPVGLNLPIVVDRAAAAVNNFVCGANEDDYHLTGCNWQRDVGDIRIADLREVKAGDPSPDGSGELTVCRGIEVGHIFQLGDKYSKVMNCRVQDEKGDKRVLQMGCYGIGITRIVAAAIEQNHDDKGIIWPETMAPFQVALIPVNIQKSEAVKNYCEMLYQQLMDSNIDVLYFDQSGARLGELLNDSELYGIPHRLVVGQRGLDNNIVEYAQRRTGETQEINCDDAHNYLLGCSNKN